jgi:hypothetical protein
VIITGVADGSIPEIGPDERSGRCPCADIAEYSPHWALAFCC